MQDSYETLVIDATKIRERGGVTSSMYVSMNAVETGKMNWNYRTKMQELYLK